LTGGYPPTGSLPFLSRSLRRTQFMQFHLSPRLSILTIEQLPLLHHLCRLYRNSDAIVMLSQYKRYRSTT
jgi:hypothetical protein